MNRKMAHESVEGAVRWMSEDRHALETGPKRGDEPLCSEIVHRQPRSPYVLIVDRAGEMGERAIREGPTALVQRLMFSERNRPDFETVHFTG
jgi:hypothetical protein